jgi:hypothetical protein
MTTFLLFSHRGARIVTADLVSIRTLVSHQRKLGELLFFLPLNCVQQFLK